MRFYAVVFCANGTYKVLPEAYSSLEAAQRFIENLSPSPKKIREMRYQDSEGGEYFIHDLLIREGDEEKTFWRVCRKYFYDGRVAVSVYTVKAAEKPESTAVEGETFDEYNDYFDTRLEADEWADNARKAGGE